MYEAGVFGARPARLPLSIGDPTLVSGSTAVTSMFELFAFYLQAGLIDAAFLGGAQIDRFGNLNTTVIGDYANPKVRLPGSGGACEIAIHARRILVIMRQAQRSFVERLDFRTSPGPLGRPGARPGPRMVRQRTDERRDRPRDLRVRRGDRRDDASHAPPRRLARGRAGEHGVGAAGRRRPRRDAPAERRGAPDHPDRARPGGRGDRREPRLPPRARRASCRARSVPTASGSRMRTAAGTSTGPAARSS